MSTQGANGWCLGKKDVQLLLSSSSSHLHHASVDSAPGPVCWHVKRTIVLRFNLDLCMAIMRRCCAPTSDQMRKHRKIWGLDNIFAAPTYSYFICIYVHSILRRLYFIRTQKQWLRCSSLFPIIGPSSQSYVQFMITHILCTVYDS